MRILVVGAGAIGSVFGGLLAESGHTVTLVGRAAHMAAIQRDGLLIDGIWGHHRITGLATETRIESAATGGPFDVVLLAVKSYDTEPVMQRLQVSMPRLPVIVSLQNGLGNLETIARYAGAARTIGRRVIFGVEYRAPGQVTVTVCADNSKIGLAAGGTPPAIAVDLARACTRAGVATDAVDDIRPYVYAKMLYNSVLNPLATILEVRYGILLESQDSVDIMRRCIDELYAVLETIGVRVAWPTPAAYAQVLFDELIPATALHHPSMLQDIRQGKRTEIDALNGAMVRTGSTHGIPMPVNTTLCRLITAKEHAARDRTVSETHADRVPQQ